MMAVTCRGVATQYSLHPRDYCRVARMHQRRAKSAIRTSTEHRICFRNRYPRTLPTADVLPILEPRRLGGGAASSRRASQPGRPGRGVLPASSAWSGGRPQPRQVPPASRRPGRNGPTLRLTTRVGLRYTPNAVPGMGREYRIDENGSHCKETAYEEDNLCHLYGRR